MKGGKYLNQQQTGLAGRRSDFVPRLKVKLLYIIARDDVTMHLSLVPSSGLESATVSTIKFLDRFVLVNTSVLCQIELMTG